MFGALLNAWWQDVEQSYRASTRLSYEYAIKELKAELGDVPVNELNTNHFKQLVKTKNRTLKRCRNLLIPARAALDDAVDSMLIPFNPLDGFKTKRYAKRKASTYIVEPYSPDEIETLLNGFTQWRPKWRNYFEYMFFTGLRPSESYALTWPDYDQKTDTMTINKTRVVGVDEDETKTVSSNRTFKHLPRAKQALENQRSETFFRGQEIFINPTTRKPITDYKQSDRAWRYVHSKLELKLRNQYQTRHSFISNLIMEGRHLWEVADLAGHKNIEMILKVYGKYIEQAKHTDQPIIKYGELTA